MANLAGISVDYLTRLEQARADHPSSQVVTAIARALRLSPAQRDHLFMSPATPRHRAAECRPS